MDSLRLEKSYRLIPRELSIEYSAHESGLNRFVQMQKENFIGRAALAERQASPNWRFVTLEVHDVTDADARGSEPIRCNGKLIGRATSGGYGWRLRKSLAMAMVRPDFGEVGTVLEIFILGHPHRATIIQDTPFDTNNERLKA